MFWVQLPSDLTSWAGWDIRTQGSRVSQIQMVLPKDLLTVSKQLETAVQSSVKGWIFLSPGFFFFFFLLLCKYPEIQPKSSVVGVGKVVCFPGPQKFQLIGLIEKESVVSGMKSLGLTEKSLDPFHARDASQSFTGHLQMEPILPPKSQPREGFTAEKEIPPVMQIKSNDFRQFSGNSVNKYITAWNTGVDLGRGEKSPLRLPASSSPQVMVPFIFKSNSDVCSLSYSSYFKSLRTEQSVSMPLSMAMKPRAHLLKHVKYISVIW